jgi:hypothetical protein
MQVEQRVHLHRAFVVTKLRPGKQRQAKIDGGGIQCVQAVVKIHADGIGGVEWPCDADQDLREVGKDAPVTRFVGVGQSGPRHLACESRDDRAYQSPNADMIRCLAGFLGKLVEQRPSSSTDPNERKSWTAYHRRNA